MPLANLNDLELENYLKCLRNLKPGDWVDYYTTQDGFTTTRKSGYWKRAEVLGRVSSTRWYSPKFIKEPAIVLGGSGIGFTGLTDFLSFIRDEMKGRMRGYNQIRILSIDTWVASILKAR